MAHPRRRCNRSAVCYHLERQTNSLSFEAVFIDEGFGMLDPETLEDVIDALERLQQGELMVGVITHVPALAERIKAGVRIEKDQGRSTVRTADAA